MNADRANAVIATFRGQKCSRVATLARIFEAPHNRLVNLADIGVDPQTHLVFLETVERMLHINRRHMELSPTSIYAELYGKGGMNGHDYALVLIAMELNGNHFEGTARVLSNNEEVIDAITLLLG
ncbi:unnamed protein product [Arabidopsis halleri]